MNPSQILENLKKELSENEYENYLSNLKIQRKTKQSRSFSFQRSK